jgi:PAS domain S-box-containing protein
MGGIDLRKFASATAMERWPWPVRALLGCCAAGVAVTLTYSVAPLRPFPLLLAFPTVILTSWYLGMWGGAVCALVDAVLVDRFLTKTQFRFSIGFAREELRLTIFLLVSILLGWAIRRLASQRSQLVTQELQQRLTIANAERQVAEERARSSEALRDRDEALQLALGSNGMGLWVWHTTENTVHWSDEVYRIAGRSPGSVRPSTDAWLSFIHPDDQKAVHTAVVETRTRGVAYHQQYRVLRPNGSVRWVESQGKGQRDSEGRVVRIVGVLADITSRKQSEEAMLRAEKLAVAGREKA